MGIPDPPLSPLVPEGFQKAEAILFQNGNIYYRA